MTPDEAIRLMELDIDDPAQVDILTLFEAEKLGIDALKRIQDLRYKGYAEAQIKLPGETQ